MSDEAGEGYLAERCCGRLLRWHEVTGPSGQLPCEQKARTFVVKMSDIKACPKQSLLPSHYRDDGSCHCKEGS